MSTPMEDPVIGHAPAPALDRCVGTRGARLNIDERPRVRASSAAAPPEKRPGLVEELCRSVVVQGPPRFSLRPGEGLFFQGDATGDTCYLIMEGQVRVSRKSGFSRDAVLLALGPGDLVGETEAFLPGHRQVSAVAWSAVVVQVVHYATLREVLSREPGLAWEMLTRLSSRLGDVGDLVSEVSYSHVSSRVAACLTRLACRFGERFSGGVALTFTQAELAELVGASREAVNRSLNEYVSRGVIQTQLGGLVILDEAALRRATVSDITRSTSAACP